MHIILIYLFISINFNNIIININFLFSYLTRIINHFFLICIYMFEFN